jgi:hypothetical protein
MLTEFKKSVNSVLNERLISPLFGTFAFSWCVWNWKILYLTIFVDTDKISEHKIDYIIDNYYSIYDLIIWPILATVVLLVIYPFLSIGAYYITLKFKKWKIDIRNKQENLQVLSIEDSIDLREIIRTQNERFDKLLTDKNKEITNLNNSINNYKNQILAVNKGVAELPKENKEDVYKTEYESMKTNENLYQLFEKIAVKAQREVSMFSDNFQLSNSDRSMFDYFLANDILEKVKSNIYKFTDKGQVFNKFRLDESLLRK